MRTNCARNAKRAADAPLEDKGALKTRVVGLVQEADETYLEVPAFAAPADGVDHRAADACLSAVRTRQP